MWDIITITDLGIHMDTIRKVIISIIKKNTRSITGATVSIEEDINCWVIIDYDHLFYYLLNILLD